MLPQPGDRNFLADLIHHVRNELPPDADFDRQIFVGLLLCLVAGGKNLVVELNETASAKTGLLQRQRVGAMVRYITTAIFGLRSSVKDAADHRMQGNAASSLVLPDPVVPRSSRRHTRSKTSTPIGARSRSRSISISLVEGTPDKPTQEKEPVAGTKRDEATTGTQPADLPQALIILNLQDAPHELHHTLLELLIRRKINTARSSMSSEHRPDGSPVLHPGDRGATAELSLPPEFVCVWIQEAYAEVPSWLVDKFALSCSASVTALDGTGEYAATPPILHDVVQGVVPPTYITTLHNLANKTHMHPTLRLHISDLTSAVLHHPRLHPNLSSQSLTDFKTFIRISRVIFRPFHVGPNVASSHLDELSQGRQYDQRRKLQEALEGEEWFATPEDVARLWGNLMRHRVGIREERDQVLFMLRGGAGYVMDGWEKSPSTPSARMPPEERRAAARRKRRKDRKDRKEVLAILKEILHAVR